MANEFTENEKAFLKRLKDERPLFKFILIFIFALLVLGLIIYAFSRLYG
jgi:hypothetical protein